MLSGNPGLKMVVTALLEYHNCYSYSSHVRATTPCFYKLDNNKHPLLCLKACMAMCQTKNFMIVPGIPFWKHCFYRSWAVGSPPFLMFWAVTPRMTDVASQKQCHAIRIVTSRGNSKTREFEDFNPSVKPEGTWEPSTAMKSFLERHFNCVLKDCERTPLWQNCPSPIVVQCCKSLR